MPPEEEVDSNDSFVPPTVEELASAIPGYEIERLIAVGGMGAVYQGLQRGLNRPVAIKILPPEIARDAEAIERFRNEAIAMARLIHANIPAVYDFDVVDGICYLVMEFIEGSNGYQLIHSGQISPERALRLLAQVCDAVAYAHGKSVVHGDLKPSNILLNADGDVKLADFGLARLMESDDRDSESWEPMGTPEYAAPELFDRTVASDHRADIYSIGVLLYEMLTGAPPQGEFELPAGRLGLDPRIDAVIAKCMALNPAERYASAAEIETILQAVIANPRVPVQAEAARRLHRPVSPANPNRKPGRRLPAHVRRPTRKPQAPGVRPPGPATAPQPVAAVRPPQAAARPPQPGPRPPAGARAPQPAVRPPHPVRRLKAPKKSATPVIVGTIVGALVVVLLIVLMNRK